MSQGIGINTHLYSLAVQAGFYGDAVECLTATREIRVRSPLGSGPKIFFFTCHIWCPTYNHPIAPCSNSPSLLFQHSLWPGSSGTKPNLVGVNVTGYRYKYTLVQPCCTSRLLWGRGRVSDCHPGDPGSIPVRVRSEDIFLHLSHLAPNVGRFLAFINGLICVGLVYPSSYPVDSI